MEWEDFFAELMSQFSYSLRVGLILNCPSILPTRTDAIGPSKGISDIVSAEDAPAVLQTDVHQGKELSERTKREQGQDPEGQGEG